MRKIFLLFIFIPAIINGQSIQEKKIGSKVNEVTVFLNSAQITRTKSVTIEKGISLLKFTELSPFIESKSIQVKSKELEILSVTFQKNFLDKKKKSPEIIELESRLEKNQDAIILERTNREIIDSEIAFLNSNRAIGGKNQSLSVTTLKEATAFYGNKLRSLKLSELAVIKKINELNLLQQDLKNQINEFSSKKDYESGEIWVKVKSTRTSSQKIELIYNVGNAGWYPSYDVRVKDISNPLSLVYKANVKQNTKVDWNEVKLRFSSATPSITSTAPALITYFLDYGSTPPSYTKLSTANVQGTIYDVAGPLPGASVLVEGTTIGTESDFEGNYSIATPKNGGVLVFSYIGFKTVKKPILSNTINVQMQEDDNVLEEVVVTSYGNKKSVSNSLNGKIAGVQIESEKNIRNKYSIPTQQNTNQTTVNFEILEPYTVLSDNKSYSVGMKTYSIPAEYQYESIPKIDENAFLIASLKNWEQYNLLEGEAAIYFENTYIGKSLLDVRFSKDKLNISLGRDKNVIIRREKLTNFTSNQLIGNKKEETKAWNISVKNNKLQAINIRVLDQIPISTRDEIKVSIDKNNTGKLNVSTGEVIWKINILPSQSKQIIFKYEVKYPKNESLIIE